MMWVGLEGCLAISLPLWLVFTVRSRYATPQRVFLLRSTKLQAWGARHNYKSQRPQYCRPAPAAFCTLSNPKHTLHFIHPSLFLSFSSTSHTGRSRCRSETYKVMLGCFDAAIHASHRLGHYIIIRLPNLSDNLTSILTQTWI